MGYYDESALNYFIKHSMHGKINHSYTSKKKKNRRNANKMANDNVTVVLRGETSFAKVLPGQLSLNYNKDGKEWKLDLVIDDATERELKKLGVGDRVKFKDNYVDGRPFITLKQPELRRDGQANDPIKIVNAANQPWNDTAELGNGSVVDVKLNIKDYGKGKKKGIYIRAIRVVKHVEYTRDEFAPITPDDPMYSTAMQAKDFEEDFQLPVTDDLNDEVIL